jgi:two-component system, OmpR family, response regulator
VIRRSLTREGLAVDVAPDGEQAIWMATAVDYDASVHSGADDYLVKPFALAELNARRRSLVRRGCPPRPTVLCVGDLRLHPAWREVHRREVRIELAAKEFALLEALMRCPGEVLTRLELIEQAWDFAYETRSNVIDVYIRRLRRKLDEPFGKSSLETVRGAGYRLRDR